ncbi:M24 family metallopeptidase [Ovoidimarina sediminis]|uniref:M24 family metallopeptidase n=1 Tax=Ovoidimarina sediminis TaxID=3079856 RepID=UPI0029125BE6|nr:Xaa-Pro peptidase family protein [Rhodophyticola sp. MJ-SS7]MDU8942192.1 Xaa-Pro peptidase family protein [Rhodophyticola sp. MJ-SS7]
MSLPDRGFPAAEFKTRLTRAQEEMGRVGLDAILLTTEPEIRYFSGFLTRFWESPTRPWYMILPAEGAPVAVIPSIGAHLMGQSWIEDLRTWNSPDYEDDGISLLAEALRETVPDGGVIGLAHGRESYVRIPLADLARLKADIGQRRITGEAGILRALRLVKSEAELSKIRRACGIAGAAFDRVSEIAQIGVPLSEVFRRFQALCLDEGADWVGYLAGAAGPGGYGDVISPASETPLAEGDVLMLDTGVVWDGYYCDFDRNFAIGAASDSVKNAYRRLVEAVEAGIATARPGVTVADLFHAMARVTGTGEGASSAGRSGHGLGMQLTEWPSLIPADRTELRPGMVLTLEPSVDVGPGRILVHEENIMITEKGAAWLSPRAPADMPEFLS